MVPGTYVGNDAFVVTVVALLLEVVVLLFVSSLTSFDEVVVETLSIGVVWLEAVVDVSEEPP